MPSLSALLSPSLIFLILNDSNLVNISRNWKCGNVTNFISQEAHNSLTYFEMQFSGTKIDIKRYISGS